MSGAFIAGMFGVSAITTVLAATVMQLSKLDKSQTPSIDSLRIVLLRKRLRKVILKESSVKNTK